MGFRTVGRVAAMMALASIVGCSTADRSSPNAPPGDPSDAGNGRDGGNTEDAAEGPTLMPGTVNPAQFGKLFERPVDGAMYAQPLYVPGVSLADGTTHNVVVLATEHDSVYAYDADDPAAAAPLWQVSLGTSTLLPNPWFANVMVTATCQKANPNLQESGITSTPVIDPATGTIYVIAFVRDDTAMQPNQTCVDIDKTSPTWCQTYTCAAPTFRTELHALDVRTGKDRAGSPVVISAQVPGTGAGSVDGVITFDPTLELQRPGLLLSKGKVYAAFGSYMDLGNYHGWILGYDATTLAQVAVFNDTPDGSQGGIWQSGASPVADEDGNVYVMTGNGTFSANTGGVDFGDTILKLDETLHVVDWFAPELDDFNGVDLLSAWDADLGSSGPVLIPGTNILVGGGKVGVLYLLDRTHLGNFDHDADDVQSVYATWRYNKTTCTDGVDSANIFGTPALWNGEDGLHLFVWGRHDFLRSYHLQNGAFSTNDTACFCEASATQPADPSCGIPDQVGTSWATSHGAFLTVSQDAATHRAIVWAVRSAIEGAFTAPVPGVFEAYDAADITQPIWSSASLPDRDAPGNVAKLTLPTVANGKVYLATGSNKLVVYGLLN